MVQYALPDLHDICLSGRGIPYNCALFGVQHGDASISSCLKLILGCRLQRPALDSQGILPRKLHKLREPAACQQQRLRSSTPSSEDVSDWALCSYSQAEDLQSLEGVSWTSLKALVFVTHSHTGACFFVCLQCCRFATQSSTKSLAQGGCGDTEANSARSLSGGLKKTRPHSESLLRLHNRPRHVSRSHFLGLRRTQVDSGGSSTLKSETACRGSGTGKTPFKKFRLQPLDSAQCGRRKVTGESVPDPLVECACSPQRLSLMLHSPVLTPSPRLIHMIACLWRDLQVDAESIVHVYDLIYPLSGSLPVYPFKLLFDPQVSCSLVISRTAFPLPPLHICRAAAAAAFLPKHAADVSEGILGNSEGRPRVPSATVALGAVGNSNTAGAVSDAHCVREPERTTGMKTAALLKTLRAAAARALAAGATQLVKGWKWRSGEFWGMCPCVPSSHRQALGHQISTMRELHWMKRLQDERKLCIRVSDLAVIIPVASACTEEAHALKLNSTPGRRATKKGVQLVEQAVHSEAGLSCDVVENEVCLLLRSCKYCCVCQRETCCCLEDPLSVLLQPPDLRLPCLWLSFGQVELLSFPMLAAEPGKVELRVTAVHLAAMARLRDSISLLQISGGNELQGTRLSMTSHQSLNSGAGSLDGGKLQPNTRNKLEPGQIPRQSNIWRIMPQDSRREFMSAAFRHFSRLGKLQRSLRLQGVIDESAAPLIVVSSHEAFVQIVCRPAHSTVARADGVVRYAFLILVSVTCPGFQEHRASKPDGM